MPARRRAPLSLCRTRSACPGHIWSVGVGGGQLAGQDAARTACGWHRLGVVGTQRIAHDDAVVVGQDVGLDQCHPAVRGVGQVYGVNGTSCSPSEPGSRSASRPHPTDPSGA